MTETTSADPLRGAPGRSLRVLLCVDSLAAAGTELNAVRTAEQLRLRGHAVTLLVLRANGPLLARCHANGVPVMEFPIPPIRSAGILFRGFALARLLLRAGVDIVHTQDRYTNMFVVPWARLAGLRVIASRRWWDVHPNRRIRVGNRLAYKLAHHVVANSERVAGLVRRVDGIPGRRIAVIPNFLEESAFRPVTSDERGRLRDLLGVPRQAHVIGCVANLRPVKAHSVLLDAMPELMDRWPDLMLALVGDGECRTALMQQARGLGIEHRVVFAGGRSDPVNWHAAFDISVLTSYSEGFPNTVIEAMAAGKPVVATAVGGTPDAIKPGLNGILVPAGAAAPIADALASLVADPQSAEAMGQNGRAEAQVRFRPEVVIPRLEELYFSQAPSRRRMARQRRLRPCP